MYCLQGVIAAEPVLRQVTEAVDGARIVGLRQNLWLWPMSDEHVRALGRPDGLGGSWRSPAALGEYLATWSAAGPLAYVEAEFFGGVGSQLAEVWENGTVVFGPVWVDDADEPPAEGSPISRALRRLGVVTNGGDEFDAVDLGRERENADWLAHSRPLGRLNRPAPDPANEDDA